MTVTLILSLLILTAIPSGFDKSFYGLPPNQHYQSTDGRRHIQTASRSKSTELVNLLHMNASHYKYKSSIFQIIIKITVLKLKQS